MALTNIAGERGDSRRAIIELRADFHFPHALLHCWTVTSSRSTSSQSISFQFSAHKFSVHQFSVLSPPVFGPSVLSPPVLSPSVVSPPVLSPSVFNSQPTSSQPSTSSQSISSQNVFLTASRVHTEASANSLHFQNRPQSFTPISTSRWFYGFQREKWRTRKPCFTRIVV